MNAVQARLGFQRRAEFGDGAFRIVPFQVESSQSKLGAGIVGIELEAHSVSFNGLVRRQQIDLHFADMTPDGDLVLSHAGLEGLLESGQRFRTATLVASNDAQLVVIGALTRIGFHGGLEITVGGVVTADSGVEARQIEVSRRGRRLRARDLFQPANAFEQVSFVDFGKRCSAGIGGRED